MWQNARSRPPPLPLIANSISASRCLDRYKVVTCSTSDQGRLNRQTGWTVDVLGLEILNGRLIVQVYKITRPAGVSRKTLEYVRQSKALWHSLGLGYYTMQYTEYAVGCEKMYDQRGFFFGTFSELPRASTISSIVRISLTGTRVSRKSRTWSLSRDTCTQSWYM